MPENGNEPGVTPRKKDLDAKMTKAKRPSKAARKAQAEALEAKWLSRSDQKLVQAGKRPRRASGSPTHIGYVHILQGGKVSPR